MGMGGLAYENNDGEIKGIGDDDGMMEVEKIKTPENKKSLLKGAGYEEVVFDVESNYSGRQVSPAAGRPEPLHSIAKANTNAVRKISACWRCKFLRKPCRSETPCATCSTGNGNSFWDIVGCKRGDLKENMAPISLCPARDRVMSSAHLASPDPKGPGSPFDENLLNHILRWHIERRDSDIRAFNSAQELPFGLTILLYSSLRAPNRLQPTLTPLNECILAIAWEFNEHPSGLVFDVLQHVGHSSLETFVTSFVLPLYIKLNLKNQLIAQSLVCLRTCLEALICPTCEAHHYYCSFNSCQVQCISDVELHTKLYLDELSSVFFGNVNPLFKDRHWISIFYSFFIQATVKKVLEELSSRTLILKRPSASTASSEDYLHLAVNLFIASSGAYDPLTTAYAISPPAKSASDDWDDIILLKQTLGGIILSSADYLRKLFDIKRFQDGKPSSHKLHGIEHVDPFTRGSYHDLRSSPTQPRYLNTKESISEESSLTDTWKMQEHSPMMDNGELTMKEASTSYEQTINDEVARQKAYKPGPALTPPSMPMANDWSPRIKPRNLDISRVILRDHSADSNPTVIYPAVIEKENTQLPDLSSTSVLEVSRALSHSEAASARDEKVSANKTVETERRKMFDDATSKENFHELSLPTMDLELLGQEHDQGYRQTTQETLVQLQQKNHLMVKWESSKDVVKRVYMTDGKTLRETMFEIEVQYDFRASERQWKQKLKQWGFRKNLSATNMQFMVAKSTRRQREEGKDTVFFYKGPTYLSMILKRSKDGESLRTQTLDLLVLQHQNR